ncbi:Gluconate transport-inducing protein [Mycoemilia scoparia]|uniref:Gluconate transport-inducing protein n=1 Tax=Mycoemilia scoparia TaxID=417184 RepID=A0A9W8DSJ3_9FUNG|nr:Gluconate transport-inducing protein [Mycoemilia scoparia]
MSSMETYYGFVENSNDVLILFEACRLGLKRQVQRRLSDTERMAIRSGSVFVWDEEQSGMKRWTDGRSWSPSRVQGCFLTYYEWEGRRRATVRPTIHPNNMISYSQNSANGGDPHMYGGAGGMSSGQGSSPSAYMPRYGQASLSRHGSGTATTTTTTTTTHQVQQGCAKDNGILKKALSVTTTDGRKLHLIAYYYKEDIGKTHLPTPSTDPELKHITIPPNMYPEVNQENGSASGTNSPSHVASYGLNSGSTTTTNKNDSASPTHYHHQRQPAQQTYHHHHSHHTQPHQRPYHSPSTAKDNQSAFGSSSAATPHINSHTSGNGDVIITTSTTTMARHSPIPYPLASANTGQPCHYQYGPSPVPSPSPMVPRKRSRDGWVGESPSSPQETSMLRRQKQHRGGSYIPSKDVAGPPPPPTSASVYYGVAGSGSSTKSGYLDYSRHGAPSYYNSPAKTSPTGPQQQQQQPPPRLPSIRVSSSQYISPPSAHHQPPLSHHSKTSLPRLSVNSPHHGRNYSQHSPTPQTAPSFITSFSSQPQQSHSTETGSDNGRNLPSCSSLLGGAASSDHHHRPTSMSYLMGNDDNENSHYTTTTTPSSSNNTNSSGTARHYPNLSITQLTTTTATTTATTATTRAGEYDADAVTGSGIERISRVSDGDFGVEPSSSAPVSSSHTFQRYTDDGPGNSRRPIILPPSIQTSRPLLSSGTGGGAAATADEEDRYVARAQHPTDSVEYVQRTASGSSYHHRDHIHHKHSFSQYRNDSHPTTPNTAPCYSSSSTHNLNNQHNPFSSGNGDNSRSSSTSTGIVSGASNYYPSSISRPRPSTSTGTGSLPAIVPASGLLPPPKSATSATFSHHHHNHRHHNFKYSEDRRQLDALNNSIKLQ